MSFVYYTVSVSRTTTNSGGDIITPTPTNQAIANSGDDGGGVGSPATIGIVAGSVGTTTVVVVVGVALAMCSRRTGTAGGGGGDDGGSATTVQSAGSAMSAESLAQRQIMISLARELASRPTPTLN